MKLDKGILSFSFLLPWLSRKPPEDRTKLLGYACRSYKFGPIEIIVTESEPRGRTER